jgi:hypothetical protein
MINHHATWTAAFGIAANAPHYKNKGAGVMRI